LYTNVRLYTTGSSRLIVPDELRGVLDVAHAGDVVIAAEQERGVVARIAMPRRGIGRGPLTEGEARSLDEQKFHDHEAVAGVLSKLPLLPRLVASTFGTIHHPENRM
jgi:hypothetical protein